jgi:hypothetical protein
MKIGDDYCVARVDLNKSNNLMFFIGAEYIEFTNGWNKTTYTVIPASIDSKISRPSVLLKSKSEARSG